MIAIVLGILALTAIACRWTEVRQAPGDVPCRSAAHFP